MKHLDRFQTFSNPHPNSFCRTLNKIVLLIVMWIFYHPPPGLLYPHGLCMIPLGWANFQKGQVYLKYGGGHLPINIYGSCAQELGGGPFSKWFFSAVQNLPKMCSYTEKNARIHHVFFAVIYKPRSQNFGYFDPPPPFVVTFTKYGLCYKMVIWLTPLPLNCSRGF